MSNSSSGSCEISKDKENLERPYRMASSLSACGARGAASVIELLLAAAAFGDPMLSNKSQFKYLNAVVSLVATAPPGVDDAPHAIKKSPLGNAVVPGDRKPLWTMADKQPSDNRMQLHVNEATILSMIESFNAVKNAVTSAARHGEIDCRGSR